MTVSDEEIDDIENKGLELISEAGDEPMTSWEEHDELKKKIIALLQPLEPDEREDIWAELFAEPLQMLEPE